MISMNKNQIFPERDILLQLPISVNSWIVLKEYAFHFGDLDIYRKIINDYLGECPLFELDQILKIARIFLNDADFQLLIIFVFEKSSLILID